MKNKSEDSTSESLDMIITPFLGPFVRAHKGIMDMIQEQRYSDPRMLPYLKDLEKDMAALSVEIDGLFAIVAGMEEN